MKQSSVLIVAVIITSLVASCNKEMIPVTFPPIGQPIADKRSIPLKEVFEQNLPSPYFKLVYDDSGYASIISFADGIQTYTLGYLNQRINKMVNTKNNEVLTYHYTGVDVSNITLHNAAGKKLRSFKFYYNHTRQLTRVDYFYVPNANPQDSLLERKVLLQYNDKGNLSRKEGYELNNHNELLLSHIIQYDDYDNGINVDDFYLLKDFFDHLLFLPQVKLQINNPKLVTIKSDQADFRIDYTYTYSNQLPVSKSGRMEQVRGENPGQVFEFINQFTYY